MNTILFPMAAAPRTHSLAVDSRMCAYRDKSVIAPVSAAERVDTVATTVGFNQGARLPRGVPR